MRPAHYLQGFKSGNVPTNMIFVDTETLNEEGRIGPGRHRLRMGAAWQSKFKKEAREPYKEERYLFTDKRRFWEWVADRVSLRETLWVFAHNWNFDGAILDVSKTLPNMGWDCTKYINDGVPPVILTWSKGNLRFKMVDSLNYFRASLAEIGASIGMPKLAMPPDTASKKDWESYMMGDVAILRAAILAYREFVLDHELGGMQNTLAGQAFVGYRRRFMPERIFIHSDERALTLERDGYHGGVTEAFYSGAVDEPLYVLDVNSMYPYIMANKPLPYHFRGYQRRYRPRLWAKVRKERYAVVARCTVQTDAERYGKRIDGKLAFPVGTFQTVLTTPEIDHAERNGELLEIHDWAYYDSGILFADYVDYFYRVRKGYREIGNDTFSYMCKILLNSLYGKWGQTGRRWEDEPDRVWTFDTPGIHVDPNGEMTKLRYRIGQVQAMGSDIVSHHSQPGITAEITAYARMRLWQLRDIARPGNVFYMDTDSLTVNEAGYANLRPYVDPNKLGALKLEWWGKSATFYAPKDYVLDGERTIKGVKRAAKEVLPRVFEQPLFRSWDYHQSHGEDGYIDILNVRKELSGANTKRVVSGDGWNAPIRLEQ